MGPTKKHSAKDVAEIRRICSEFCVELDIIFDGMGTAVYKPSDAVEAAIFAKSQAEMVALAEN